MEAIADYINEDVILNVFFNLPEKFMDKMTKHDVRSILQHHRNFQELSMGSPSRSAIRHYIKEQLSNEGITMPISYINATLQTEEEYYYEMDTLMY